ncbi:deacetylase sulfotransferase [Roseobacter cerasinus]|uniref:Deacetylase sulfotransferase n=1 Tax=Roseobacter cerasinus TaxID=2602289 RepID=A0A640VZF5_9RHOB|nr:sulfotransferase domain-containing protein [Roseobacter cerasinus]GFE52491.1 deacetylase sulfotransferase [Roseobacter cerasinus]
MPSNTVDFFIAGVQKGGTTALHKKLQGHPEIFLSQKKEIHFFDNDALDWQAPPYEKLHSHFDFTQDRVFGEATPVYTYWPDALRRLKAYNPQAKIIIILRHPTFRARSAWKMEVTRGAEKWGFGLAVSKLGRARVRWSRGGVHRVYSYVERGYYARQIAELLEYFPREQVFFCTSDQLWHTEQDTLAQICTFLGVAPPAAGAEAGAEKYVVPVDSSQVVVKTTAVEARLNQLFRDEIIATAKITGLDLSHWLEDGYSEPMQQA